MESITEDNVVLVLFLLEIDDLDTDGLGFSEWFGEGMNGLTRKVSDNLWHLGGK